MLHPPKVVLNNFAVHFPRQIQIRRSAYVFEDILSGQYGQAQVFAIPDELDPQIPRIVFNSMHGFSSIQISQISIALTVGYSPDYQTDQDLRLKYLEERAPLLFDLLDKVSVSPLFCGLTTNIVVDSDRSDEELIRALGRSIKLDVDGYADVVARLTQIADDKFFVNTVYENARVWDEQSSETIPRLSYRAAVQRNLSISHEFNDRYAYNESSDYYSGRDSGLEIIKRAHDSVHSIIEKVVKEGTA